MKAIVNGFLLALQFLTTIPLKRQVPWNEHTAKWSVRAYSTIGLLCGLLLAIQFILLTSFTPISATIIAFWLLFFSVMFSGGLHVDGWMDTSDAFFSYRDRDRKLEIMSDSRVGAFGVISMVFLLGFRFLFIYEVIQILALNSVKADWLLICVIPMLSRTVAALLLISGKPAKSTGLAASFQMFLVKNDRIYVVGIAIITLSILLIIAQQLLLPVAIMLLTSSFLLLIAKRFFENQFGGITGDTIGALIEGEETLLWGVLYLLLSFVMV